MKLSEALYTTTVLIFSSRVFNSYTQENRHAISRYVEV